MIDGFRVDVTAEELVTHIDARIAYHRERIAECESKLRRLEALDSAPGEDEEEMFEMCASSRLHGLERLVARHRNREAFLVFAHEHVAAREIYRLTEDDLRLLEWLPVEGPDVMMARI
jgi:hypothetical protein